MAVKNLSSIEINSKISIDLNSSRMGPLLCTSLLWGHISAQFSKARYWTKSCSLIHTSWFQWEYFCKSAGFVQSNPFRASVHGKLLSGKPGYETTHTSLLCSNVPCGHRYGTVKVQECGLIYYDLMPSSTLGFSVQCSKAHMGCHSAASSCIVESHAWLAI